MSELYTFVATAALVGVLGVYCIVSWLFYLGSAVYTVLSDSSLLKNPYWILCTFVVMVLSPVILPFAKGWVWEAEKGDSIK
ncbi:hypothetical protein [Vibrio harveyi]|uniref:Uncharacterized protein n=1 Tax=Vibrio harveyi TaxID=669 RepID=A0A8B3DNN9_VIBHA|nr:hypothetical protein [Vibrio harveyi]RIW17930.1 hypothetical protein DS957_003955 [Vibrio harveyi]